MTVCPACRSDNPDGFSFCGRCGTILEDPPAHPAERKTVSTLFCDLVAFTTMGEQADPEDVDALLRAYRATARKVIESHGGVVEKFIGDAVVGVFGVPVAHEDDPERAVRAGLRIVQALEGVARPDGSPLEVRIGVNTGEALVRLDVAPASGEGFLTGDAVNTAARLQAAAPPGGVAAGALTHELTQRRIAYAELRPVTAKGKAEPVAVWLAGAAVSRMGAVIDGGRLTPLAGREAELAYVKALFDKAVAAASPQFALIVGDPGLGKSRLVQELLTYVDGRPEMTTWRQGRCLPYGDGVTFWALAEIVKACAGILETDDGDTAEAKLEEVLPENDDRAWLRRRLRALLGLDAAKSERAENFTAWLHFLEDLAVRRPTVLVLEDLHWAEDALLDFVEFFALHVTQVPVMVVMTSRPDLFERRPSFAAAVRMNRITLEPLSRPETEELIGSVLEESGGDLRRAIAEQAQGNPFFAEESARLARDRVRGEEQVGTSLLAGSVQAVIAARLDALAPEQKAILADAAVAGQVFWDGLVAAMSGRSPEQVSTALDALVGKHLVRRVRASAMAGEREYAFGHALALEVAYGQLPRLARAKKHAAVAAWIEEKAGDRAEDPAEVLAHHYVTAFELAQAAHEVGLAESLREPALHALTLAGARAVSLDIGAAERYFRRAQELSGADSPERPGLLMRWAEALFWTGRFREAADALRGVVAAAETAGDIRVAARALARLADLGATFHDRSTAHFAVRAMESLEDEGPSSEKADVLGMWAAYLSNWGDDPRGAIRAGEQAASICAGLGLPEPVPALTMVATARCDLGEAGGLDDYSRAIAAGETQGLGAELASAYENYGGSLRQFRGPMAAVKVHQAGLDLARRRGIEANVRALSVELVTDYAVVGEWDEALALAATLVPLLEEAEDTWDLLQLRPPQTLILVRRGQASDTAPFLAWLTERGRESEVAFIRAYALLSASAAHLSLGSTGVAVDMLTEWAMALPGAGKRRFVELVPEAVRSAVAAADAGLAALLVERLEVASPIGAHALASAQALLLEERVDLAQAAPAFADAAVRWHDFEVPYEEAQALLGLGRCLGALGRAPEAAAPLAAAREIFARLGAKPALDETEARLADVSLLD